MRPGRCAREDDTSAPSGELWSLAIVLATRSIASVAAPAAIPSPTKSTRTKRRVRRRPASHITYWRCLRVVSTRCTMLDRSVDHHSLNRLGDGVAVSCVRARTACGRMMTMERHRPRQCQSMASARLQLVRDHKLSSRPDQICSSVPLIADSGGDC